MADVRSGDVSDETTAVLGAVDGDSATPEICEIAFELCKVGCCSVSPATDDTN